MSEILIYQDNVSKSNEITVIRKFRTTAFIGKGFLVKPNFIEDNEVWFVNNLLTNSQYTIYEKFNLRVQLAVITCQPEILLSYEGRSKVFKKNIAQLLADVSTTCFVWVVFKENLYKYKHLHEEAKRNLEEVYPVWNFDIRDALHQATEAPEKGNKYEKYLRNITGFVNKYLNTPEFKQVIPLNNTEFVKVNNISIGSVNPGSNQLSFGNNQLGKIPKYDMSNYGPFGISPYANIHFFYIFHTDDRKATDRIDKFFKGDLQGFKGLLKYAKIAYHTQEKFSIQFKDKENPLPEIEQELVKRPFDPDVHYIAIYLSPFSKYVTEKSRNLIYFRLKEMLLKRGITSQALEAEKIMTTEKYHYSLPNIAIAILAKLNGTPWRLNTRLKNELVVGVGAFRNSVTDVQYIGSAFSFSNNGKFNRFECFQKDQTEELAGSIIRAIKEYAAVNSNLDRLIIHFYKKMSDEELAPIEKGLRNLGLPIPVFIISINKTESNDIVAFDDAWVKLMPISGTFINLGRNKYLLFNNTRYEGAEFSDLDGFPFPIKLGIECTDPERLKDSKTISELIDQVYQFSRMYWKSVRQQNLPVTIKYPEMVASIYQHFDGDEIPNFGKDNLWFL